MIAGVRCDIVFANATWIICDTRPLNLTAFPDRLHMVNVPQTINVHISAGNCIINVYKDDVTFTYKPDPNVTDIRPLNSFLRYNLFPCQQRRVCMSVTSCLVVIFNVDSIVLKLLSFHGLRKIYLLRRGKIRGVFFSHWNCIDHKPYCYVKLIYAKTGW